MMFLSVFLVVCSTLYLDVSGEIGGGDGLINENLSECTMSASTPRRTLTFDSCSQNVAELLETTTSTGNYDLCHVGIYTNGILERNITVIIDRYYSYGDSFVPQGQCNVSTYKYLSWSCSPQSHQDLQEYFSTHPDLSISSVYICSVLTESQTHNCSYEGLNITLGFACTKKSTHGEQNLILSDYQQARNVTMVYAFKATYSNGVYWAVHELVHEPTFSEFSEQINNSICILAGNEMSLTTVFYPAMVSTEHYIVLPDTYHITRHTNLCSTAVLNAGSSTSTTVAPSGSAGSGTPLTAHINGGPLRTITFDTILRLDGSSSGDPDGIYSTSALSYTWFCCLTESEVNITRLKLHSDSPQTGCSGHGYRLPYDTLLIEDANFTHGPLPVTYYLTLLLEATGRESGSYTQQVHVTKGDPPIIDVVCIQNCATILSPSDKLVVVANCTSCSTSGQELTYEWGFNAVTINSTRTSLDWSSETSTGNRLSNLVIKSRILTSPQTETYTLFVNATRNENYFSGFAAINVTTNPPPYGGHCEVEPTNGFVLVTKFVINCTGFMDDHLPLTYKMYLESDNPNDQVDDADRRMLLYSGYQSASPQLHLPVGQESRNFTKTVFAQVEDSYGSMTEVIVYAAVRQQTIELSTLESLVSGSELGQLVQSGDVQTATGLIIAVTSVLNVAAGGADNNIGTQSERQQLRSALISSLGSMEVGSVADLQQIVGAMSDVTSVKEELSPDAQHLAASIVNSLASVLMDASSNGTISEDIVKICSFGIVKSVSCLVGSFDSSPEDTNNTMRLQAKQQYSETAKASLSAVDNVKSSLLVKKVVGEEPTVIKGNSMVLQLSKLHPQNLMEEAFNVSSTGSLASGVKNEIQIPSSFDVSSYMGGSEGSISAEIVQFTNNPYLWSNRSSNITSVVSDFVLRHDTSEVVVSGLIDPVSIFLPQTSSSILQQQINITSGATNAIYFDTVDNGSAVLLFLAPSSDPSNEAITDIKLKLTVLQLVGPNEDTPITAGTLTNRTKRIVKTVDILGSDLSVGITPTSLPILVLQPEELVDAGSFAVTFTNQTDLGPLSTFSMVLMQGSCMIWDVRFEEWTTSHCKVGNRTTVSHIQCLCTHMTAFAGGLIILPNKLDFSKITMFLTFWQNPVAIALVVLILTMYILLLVWARRKDREDKLKAEAVDLADNHPEAMYPYAVAVYTGSRPSSGTTATVVLMLIGDTGRSSPHLLKAEAYEVCQRGSIDIFILRTHRPLGRIQAVRIWHDNSGSSPDWFLSRIIVKDLLQKDSHHFMCDSWLSEHGGDSCRDKTFLAVPEEETKQFGYLMRTRSGKELVNDNVWISVVARPVQSPFTRVQRLTCCLSLLASYMLGNIMFYGVEGDDNLKRVMENAPVKVDLKEFIIAVETALLFLPANMLFVEIFKWAKWKQPEKSYETIQQAYEESKKWKSERSISLPSGDEEGETGGEECSEEAGSSGISSESDNENGIDALPKSQPISDIMPDSTQTKLAAGKYGNPENPLFLGISSIFHRICMHSTRLWHHFVVHAFHICRNRVLAPLKSTATMSSTQQEETNESGARSYNVDRLPSSQPSTSNRTQTKHQMNKTNNANASDIGKEDKDDNFPRYQEATSSTQLTEELGSLDKNEAIVTAVKRSEISPNGLEDRTNISHSKECKAESETSLEHIQDLDTVPKGTIRHSLVNLRKRLKRARSVYPLDGVPFGTASGLEVFGLPAILSHKPYDAGHNGFLECGSSPWMMLKYTNWVTMSLFIVVMFFFTILYSFDYGVYVTSQWVKSFVLSVFMDVVLQKPAQAILLAAVISLVWRKPSSDSELRVVKKWRPVIPSQRDIDIKERNDQWKKDRENPAYIPPTSGAQYVSHAEKKEQNRLYGLLREFGGYLFYMYLILLISYGRRDYNVYNTNKVFADALFRQDTYHEMSEGGGFWTWMNSTVKDVIYPQGGAAGQVDGFMGLLVREPLLRQVRVKQEDCCYESVLEKFPGVICTHNYETGTRDTRSYTPQWNSFANIAEGQIHDQDAQPWVYFPTIGYSIEGVFSNYPEGGYVQYLGKDRAAFEAAIDPLYSGSWLDRQTAVAVLEIETYNANTNLLTIILGIIEVPSHGSTKQTFLVRSMKLYRSTSSMQIFLVLFEVVFCGYTLGFFIRLLVHLQKSGKAHFKMLLAWVDLTLLVFSIVGIGIYAEHAVEVNRVVANFKMAPVNFSYAMSLDNALAACMGVLVCVGTVKGIHIMRFSERIHILSLVTTRVMPGCLAVMLALTIWKLGFACLVNLLLGTIVEPFRTVWKTFGMIAFDVDLECKFYLLIHPTWGPLIYCGYIVVRTYILTNLLVTVLMNTMEEVARASQPSEDVEFIRHMVQKARHWFRVKQKVKVDTTT